MTLNNKGDRKNLKISQKQNPKSKGIIAAIICFLCFSCGEQALYERYQAIDNTLWEKDKTYYFTFRIDDISVPYNLSLEVRNNNMYPYQNLWIFCNEEQPIGELKRDTMECVLADDFGKWHGKGISLFQSSFPVHSVYKFPYAGQYTFSFKQGMRDHELKGIQEIGLRVEKANQSAFPTGSIQTKEDK